MKVLQTNEVIGLYQLTNDHKLQLYRQSHIVGKWQSFYFKQSANTKAGDIGDQTHKVYKS